MMVLVGHVGDRETTRSIRKCVLRAGGVLSYRDWKEVRQHYLMAINPADGSEKWKHEIHAGSSPVIGEDGTVYIGAGINNEVSGEYDNYLYAVNPDGNIYFGSYSTVYAVDPNGNLKWKVTAAKESTPGSKGTDAWILASLVIDNKGIAYLWSDQVYGIQTGAKGLANSPWPKYRCNNKNTGCIASK